MITRRQKRLHEALLVDGANNSSNELPDEEKKNPLLNEVVLTRLFEVCPLTDLRQFRLVSKLWYSLSLSICRREMTLRIHMKAMSVDVLRSWKREIEQLEMGCHPFKSYNFHGFAFVKGYSCCQSRECNLDPELDRLYNQPEIQVWNKFGPSIRKLTLSGAIVICVLAFKQSIFEETPNLEELHIHHALFSVMKCCVEPHHSPATAEQDSPVKVQPNLKSLIVTRGLTPFLISWKLIFSHFPNLQKIKLKGFTKRQEFLHFVEALEEVNNAKREEIVIKDFTFWCRFDKNECTLAALRLLRLPQMKLEALSMKDVNTKENTNEIDVIPQAVQMHGRNLKKLEIKNGSLNETREAYLNLEPYKTFPFQTGNLNSMTELTLVGVVTPNLHFLHQFPNLKVLRIRQNREDRVLEGTDFSTMKDLVLPHVTQLEFRVVHATHFHISEERMKLFVKMMPNVDHFDGNLLPAGLRILCRNWRRMRKLWMCVAIGKTEPGGDDDSNILWRETWLSHIRTLNDLQNFTAAGKSDDPDDAWIDFDELPYLRTFKFVLISTDNCK